MELTRKTPEYKTFPSDFKNDQEFIDAALDDFRREHGFSETIRVGDLDPQSRTTIIRRAQRLKMKQREGAA